MDILRTLLASVRGFFNFAERVEGLMLIVLAIAIIIGGTGIETVCSILIILRGSAKVVGF